MIQVKKIRFVVLTLAMLLTLPICAVTKVLRGDLNSDGKLSLEDLTKMIQLLNSKQDAMQMLKATPALDVNRDGKFSKDDVTDLAKAILGKINPGSITLNGGFTDEDLNDPSDNIDTEKGFKDEGQSSPGTEESSGGFKDEDMVDPDSSK